MKKLQIILLLIIAFACSTPVKKEANNKQLAESIAKNEYFPFVKSKAIEIMKSGFNAGSGTYRCEAGVLFTAIRMFEEWKSNQK